MERLARWAVRRRLIVVVGWLVAVFAVTAAVGAAGASFSAGFNLPGTDSQAASDLLREEFVQASADSDRIVWQVVPEEGSVTDADVSARTAAMLDEVADVEGVVSVGPPTVSRDGRTAFAVVQYSGEGGSGDVSTVARETIQAVVDSVESARTDDLRVEIGGPVAGQLAGPQVDVRELLGVLFAAVLLLVVYRSLAVMLVTVGTALVSMMVGQSGIALLTNVAALPNTAPTVALLLGLGVGIDYALFVVNRHRAQVRAGMSVEESVVRAMNTSGRGVVFAGVTVVVALLGLLLLRISVLTGMGVAAALSVSVAVLGSLTLLPAVLSYTGTRVLPRRERAALLSDGAGSQIGHHPSSHIASAVSRTPILAVVGGTLAMLALSIPVLSMRLGVADQGTNPEGTTTREAYDLLAEGFGPGFNGPLAVVVALDPQSAPAGGSDPAGIAEQVDALAAELAATKDVAAVSPAVISPSGRAALIQVVPATGPQDQRTSDLIERLRSEVLPSTAGVTAHVGGITATFDDFTAVIASRFWEFVAVVAVVSILVLVLAFRSLWMPSLGALLNLLSTAAAFGVVVAVFQWGWGADLLGVATGPVEPFVPVLAFAILFGLSMDYQVFLVTRVREEWVRTRDARRAVRVGQADTGRVIAVAALIMIFVFSSFVLSDARSVKLVGFAMAVAVAIDAFVIRQFVVPGLLHLLAERAWYLPAWLDRRLPRVSVDGPPLEGGSHEGPADVRHAPSDAGSPATGAA